MMSVNITLAENTTLDDAECELRFNFILNSGIAGMICLLGIIGNAVSFAVLLKDTHAPLASLLLRALAFADTGFVLTWFVCFSLRDAMLYYGLEDSRTWLMCQLFAYPLLFVGQTGTVCMTVVIAASRYVAVCMPHRAVTLCTMSVGRISIAVVGGFSILYNLPRFFEVQLEEEWSSHANHTVYFFNSTPLGASKVYKDVYFHGLYYVMSFGLPLLMLAFLNARLTFAYRAVQRRRMQMTSRRRENNDNALTLVMIVVVLVFMACNAPARVVQMLWDYRKQPCASARFVLMQLSGVLEVLNSSVNFIIYCICRRQFRSILQHRLCSVDPMVNQRRQPQEFQPLEGPTAVITNGMSEFATPADRRLTVEMNALCHQNVSTI